MTPRERPPAAGRTPGATGDAGGGDPCMRCGNPVWRTGRRFGPRRACPSCAPYYREARECPACGLPSTRLVKSKTHGAAVCDRCRNAIDHRNCARCGWYRRVAGTDPEGRPVCQGCWGPNPRDHACPDCGTPLPGGGNSRCDPCALHRRLWRRVAQERTRLSTVAGHEVLDAYAHWLEAGGLKPRDVRRFEVQAEALSHLEDLFDAEGRLEQDAVLDALGVDGAKRAQRLIDHLCEAGRLDWDHVAQSDWIEERRADAILAAADAAGRGALLRDYRDHLTAPGRRPLRPSTLRMYLRVALGFAKHADIVHARAVTSTKLLSYLRRVRGQRASITPFKAFAEAAGAGPLTLPSVRRASVRTVDKISEDRGLRMRRRLAGPTTAAERRALVIGSIATFYGVPMEEVAAIGRDDVVLRPAAGTAADGGPSGGAGAGPEGMAPTGVVLRGDVHVLPDWLGAALREVLPDTGRWAFPGRGGRRPITPASVWHHLRADGSGRPGGAMAELG